MSYTIAIQPDIREPKELNNYSSPVWEKHIKEAGHAVRIVNVMHSDILDQLRGCHGFLWRHSHLPDQQQVALNIVPVLEKFIDIDIWPDYNTCWHYDNKVAQKFLFEANNIPTPKTWVWYDESLAKAWAFSADYPIVMKLACGAGSSNVILIKSYDEAEYYIELMFSWGTNTLSSGMTKLWFNRSIPWGRRRLRSIARVALKGLPTYPPKPDRNFWRNNKNYVYFQEFLENNDFDTRVIVVGNRAFALRRYNRDNDFRASGSGKLDFSPEKIDLEAVKLAFEVSGSLKFQSMAYDILRKDGENLIGEISYTHPSNFVSKAPGFWDSDLNWRETRMTVEQANVEDMIARLDRKFTKE